MKGNEQVINELNYLLSEELTAINQYMVHAEMDENWNYAKLHDNVYKRSIVEMKHAEKLIERILYLEGRPIVSNLMEIKIGDTVPTQFDNDLALEVHAVKHYNDSIRLCVEKGDSGTKELLEAILKDEEDHVDDLEAKQDQIAQMGLPHFLSTQV
ncbi:MAG: bacterioferritin [Planctomycetes bacterium]|jgi:bacterioferritin|nr:bacterioferritin [Planctomycetota bacterium]